MQTCTKSCGALHRWAALRHTHLPRRHTSILTRYTTTLVAQSSMTMALRSSATTSSATATCSGLLRRSAICRREFRKPPTRQDLIEIDVRHADSLDRSGPLDVNLFEDPSGGLSGNAAEELTAAELESQLRILASAYSAELFYLLYTPLVDLVGLLVTHNLLQLDSTKSSTQSTRGSTQNTEQGSSTSSSVTEEQTSSTITTTTVDPDTIHKPRPSGRIEDELSRWFTDGATTLREPQFTEKAMGPARWAAFANALRAHYRDLEPVMPLTRVIRRHTLNEALLLPVLRQLAMDLANRGKRAATVAILPGFVLALANGRAPTSLQLPNEDATARVNVVSELLMGVAQETGNTDLAFLGLQLLRANQIPTPPFARQKQLTNVFSSAARIETDWRMRVTGLLVEAFPRWLLYYKQVHKDNAAALERLTKEKEEEKDKTTGVETSHAARTTTTGKVNATNESDGEVYFGSRRSDAVARTAELERNILAAVRSRAATLNNSTTRDGSKNGCSSGGGKRGKKAQIRTATAKSEALTTSQNSNDGTSSKVTTAITSAKRRGRRRSEPKEQTSVQVTTQEILGEVFEL